MSAARRFALALGAVMAGALVLRLWGVHNGLPYVYNADENAHFVPRAIGMFGHGYNPGYFINPPAFTYLLHVAFWLRWGGAGVQRAFAADPSGAFTLARALSALLGVAAVGLLAWAGARLWDRRIGLLAAAILAVSFLPVNYAHYALNDVPAMAPVCLALAGIAGVLRTGRTRDHLLAGAAIGVGAATKYTDGYLVLPLATAALLAPGELRRRVRNLALAGVLAAGGFLVANPYALLDAHAFRAGLRQQSEAASAGGKLGLTDRHPLLYYLSTLTWGLGWIPALASLGAAIGLALRERRTAAVLVPGPLLFLAYMGLQDRFFARWLLPIYPILCLLAAWGAATALRALPAERPRLVRGAAWAAAVALLLVQGLVYTVHNDVVLSRPDTRAQARAWMVAHVPEGAKVVVEPIAPDQWAMDVGHPSRVTGNGNRWRKWRTSRSLVNNNGTVRRGRGRVVKLEDYERTTRPALVGAYARGGFCWVVTGSTQYGRAFAQPAEVPQALRYYQELRRVGTVAYRVTPYRERARPVPFSFDFSFNAYPLRYARAGPEIVIYRLHGGACGP